MQLALGRAACVQRRDLTSNWITHAAAKCLRLERARTRQGPGTLVALTLAAVAIQKDYLVYKAGLLPSGLSCHQGALFAASVSLSTPTQPWCAGFSTSRASVPAGRVCVDWSFPRFDWQAVSLWYSLGIMKFPYTF